MCCIYMVSLKFKKMQYPLYSRYDEHYSNTYTIAVIDHPCNCQLSKSRPHQRHPTFWTGFWDFPQTRSACKWIEDIYENTMNTRQEGHSWEIALANIHDEWYSWSLSRPFFCLKMFVGNDNVNIVLFIFSSHARFLFYDSTVNKI